MCMGMDRAIKSSKGTGLTDLRRALLGLNKNNDLWISQWRVRKIKWYQVGDVSVLVMSMNMMF